MLGLNHPTVDVDSDETECDTEDTDDGIDPNYGTA